MIRLASTGSLWESASRLRLAPTGLAYAHSSEILSPSSWTELQSAGGRILTDRPDQVRRALGLARSAPGIVDYGATRALRHLSTVGRHYPSAWETMDDFRAGRGRDLPAWPDWCFCPLAGAYAISSGGGPNRLSALDQIADVSAIGALAAWRPTQGVYRYDHDMLAALWATPLEGRLPDELFYRLPEWCVYVEAGGRACLDGELYGFFAHMEWDSNSGHPELRLLLDMESGLIPIPIHLGGGAGIREALEATVFEARRHAADAGINASGLKMAWAQAGANAIAPLISLLLYLCSQEPEITLPNNPGALPGNPALKKIKGGNIITPPAPGPRLWRGGEKIGGQLRAASVAVRRLDERQAPRPHIRRAHWHTYRVGPRAGYRLELRWIAPTLILARGNDDEKNG